ncbi:hypothetical protein VTJ83DRAFT_1856 [Remersonia thermophila]|uniref:Uncharacterized protein n=1 Tax=Remersonia thermophila TaxID=72144 RepID=A0ABR4DJE7_9PEZI
MPDSSNLSFLLQLLQYPGLIARLTLSTSYGLAIELGSDGPVAVSLCSSAAPAASSAAAAPSSGGRPGRLGYRYHVEPDYQTSFLWYATGWPGNPDDQHNVEEQVLEERYPAAFCRAWDAWVGRYTRGFEANECHHGSGAEPLPDKSERLAWELEGLLLAAWLALQPDVDQVTLPDYDLKTSYVVDKAGAGETVERFWNDLRHRYQL